MGKSLKAAGFGGLKVVAFESRRAQEIATLISAYGGVPLVAPSMREIPLGENPAAFGFAERLFAGELDAVIFMTGVGTADTGGSASSALSPGEDRLGPFQSHRGGPWAKTCQSAARTSSPHHAYCA